jgi:hypothetical protein
MMGEGNESEFFETISNDAPKLVFIRRIGNIQPLQTEKGTGRDVNALGGHCA